MMKIDDQDRKVLRILQRDGRISNQDLADRAGLSTSSCWRRVKSLEDSGIIRGYVALIDADAAGLTFHAVVHVQLARHEEGALAGFVEAVTRRSEVLDCFATTGEADYHLRVLCADLEAYNVFLENFLFRLPGIQSARTSLILKQIKHEVALPV